MIKLYRTMENVTEYWEFWESGAEVIVHWGTIGDKGNTKEFNLPKGTRAERLIENEMKELISGGYAPVDSESMAQVVIQYQIKGMGSAKDLNKAQELEDLMNECLGWTGLGHCDGHDIGSGTLKIFCDVVDGLTSEQVVLDALKQAGQLKGATAARRERVGPDDYVVFWPKEFTGDFDLM